MFSVYNLDGLSQWARRSRVGDDALKRFRVAFFKKALPVEECVAGFPGEARTSFVASVAMPELTLVSRRDSAVDGATKLMLRTSDGHFVESVILRVASGRTSLCISSQVGCAANCAFCATGKLGLARNLTADEILAQVSLAQRLVRAEGRVLRNIVFMGMGEPLHNEKNLYAALDVLRDPRAFYFADRHLMVSTVGMVAAMGRFLERFPTVNLALSLHSARQEVRRELMPAAKSQTLEKLRAVFPVVGSPAPLMVEYVLLKGVNDGPDDLAALIDYLSGAEVHINLIQFNPYPGAAFTPVTQAEREAFARALRRAGYKVTLRRSLGDDIAAACGQLAGSGRGAG